VQEQRPRVAVPVDTRRATLVIHSPFRLRAELADFAN
jgi:hypothetical protein